MMTSTLPVVIPDVHSLCCGARVFLAEDILLTMLTAMRCAHCHSEVGEYDPLLTDQDLESAALREPGRPSWSHTR